MGMSWGRLALPSGKGIGKTWQLAKRSLAFGGFPPQLVIEDKGKPLYDQPPPK